MVRFCLLDVLGVPNWAEIALGVSRGVSGGTRGALGVSLGVFRGFPGGPRGMLGYMLVTLGSQMGVQKCTKIDTKTKSELLLFCVFVVSGDVVALRP